MRFLFVHLGVPFISIILALVRPNLPLGLRLVCLLGIPFTRRNLRKEVGSFTSQSLAPVQDFEPPRDRGMENPTESCTNNTMSENDRFDVANLENVEEKNHGDETEVRIEINNNEAEQGHTRKLDKYDPSLDIPIALRKEMKALEKNRTWEICVLYKGHKTVGCKWVFSLKYKADGTLDRHMASWMLKMVFEWRPCGGSLHEPTPGFEAQFGNLVTWRSKKQSVVARSSAEAEYRAMSLGICEKIWLQKVLSDLHQECETPLKLFCDNKTAISIANNPIQHDRTQHVEIDRYFIKERLDSGCICITYIPSNQEVADVLTKELLRPHFDLCVSKLRLIDIYVST
ncbi:putative mitochondrial protein [Cucumis melo var. makuwa]|uniref:Mitochondrial protein n=1 Tax=Cucumis melo var. makuwa TaxID=1194695 RepID=A0A5A7UFQ7_CUCMM|nr:putative mitochondrial protein [Cucumis melo var. makuwa]TYK27575.1 putative mitochondrial protein [Cucumis melo var. makuwa]